MKKGIPFTADGVYITLPKKNKHLKVKKDPNMGVLPPGVSGRIVMKFEIYDPNDKKVDYSDESFELRVRFNKRDEKRAENANKELELKYKPGKEWIKFENVEMISEGKKKGGVGVVEITDWDPAIGWFP